jgi:hypothetical protein
MSSTIIIGSALLFIYYLHNGYSAYYCITIVTGVNDPVLLEVETWCLPLEALVLGALFFMFSHFYYILLNTANDNNVTRD